MKSYPRIFMLLIIINVLVVTLCSPLTAQTLEVEGVIQLRNSSTSLPQSGMIRWNGIDFEGFTGSVWVSLTSGSTVTDIEGNIYNTVAIGSQIWMSENLRTTKLNTGIDIPLIEDGEEWINMQSMAYSWFENNKDTLQLPYGAYYNLFAAQNSDLCPLGWRVPTMSDWMTLRDYLGNDLESGNKMKALDTIYWDNTNVGASNASGFNGYPAGFRTSGFGGIWLSGSLSAQWHSSDSSQRAWLRSDVGSFGFIQDIAQGGAPVRCIKD